MTSLDDLRHKTLMDFPEVQSMIPRLANGDTLTVTFGPLFDGIKESLTPLAVAMESAAGTFTVPTKFIPVKEKEEMVNNRDIVEHILETSDIELADMAGWANDLGRVAKEMLMEKMAEEKYGKDDYKDGDIISFTFQFREDGTKYRYAAIKIGELWYTTGPRSPKGYKWVELNRWWDDGKLTKLTLMKKASKR